MLTSSVLDERPARKKVAGVERIIMATPRAGRQSVDPAALGGAIEPGSRKSAG